MGFKVSSSPKHSGILSEDSVSLLLLGAGFFGIIPGKAIHASLGLLPVPQAASRAREQLLLFVVLGIPCPKFGQNLTARMGGRGQGSAGSGVLTAGSCQEEEFAQTNLQDWLGVADRSWMILFFKKSP